MLKYKEHLKKSFFFISYQMKLSFTLDFLALAQLPVMILSQLPVMILFSFSWTVND